MKIETNIVKYGILIKNISFFDSDASLCSAMTLLFQYPWMLLLITLVLRWFSCPCDDIFSLGASAAATEFQKFRLDLISISLIEIVRSSQLHFHDF